MIAWAEDMAYGHEVVRGARLVAWLRRLLCSHEYLWTHSDTGWHGQQCRCGKRIGWQIVGRPRVRFGK